MTTTNIRQTTTTCQLLLERCIDSLVYPFDYDDLDYLLRHLSAQQLRHEIHQADIKYSVDTALGEDGAFPWREYRDTCQLALKFKLLEAPVPQMGDGNRHSLDIQEVKQANDIVATIERYTTLRKSGRNYYSGLCPLHDDTHPSFFVYPDDQRWWCFGCNRGGDIIDFAQAMHRVTTSEAVKMLAGGVR